MLRGLVALLTAGLVLASYVVAEGHQVCSPTGCVDGESSSKILVSDKDLLTSLTPGTYMVRYNPTTHFNQTVSTLNPGTYVKPPTIPVVFSSAAYLGDTNTPEVTDKIDNWGSAYIPDGWYAAVSPGNALWDPVPDRSKLPGITTLGPFASGICDPPCARGSCNNGECTCLPGWTGAGCDACAPNFYGPSCAPCSGNCTTCDDGIAGSGFCVGATTSPEKCNCLFGTCENGGCTCAGGHKSVDGGANLCSACVEEGFYADSAGRCTACPYGCTACEVLKGTDTVTCTACATSLQLLPNVPATCGTSTTCTATQYFDSSSGSCKSCSTLCGACYGPGITDCITCGVNKGLFKGRCVTYTGDGVCDAKTDGTLVFNPTKRKCDACPEGCKSCFLPNFWTPSGATSVFEPSCSGCSDGYLLYQSACVKQCPLGLYATAKGTCEACTGDCKSCIGTASYCTSCTTGLASNGTCASSCTSSTVQVNNTCVQCHPDCATCSGASATSCATCPPSRPVLSNGRCVPVCPKGTYFNSAGANCLPCTGGCTTCISAGTCTSCPASQELSNGACLSPTCKGPYVSSLAVCLSLLVDKKPHAKDLSALAALIFIPLLILLVFGFLWIRRERRKTRDATREFATKIDDDNVGRRLKSLSTTVFDRAFGRDRTPPTPDVEREVGRGRLRSLVLRRESGAEIPMRRVSFASDIPSGREIMRAARTPAATPAPAPVDTNSRRDTRGTVEMLNVDMDPSLPPYSPSEYTPASYKRPLPHLPSHSPSANSLQLMGMNTPEPSTLHTNPHHPVAAAIRSHSRGGSGGSAGSGSVRNHGSGRTDPQTLREVWPAFRVQEQEQPRARIEGGWV